MSFPLLSHVFCFVLMQKNRQRILFFNLRINASFATFLYKIIGLSHRPEKDVSYQRVSDNEVSQPYLLKFP